MPINPQAPLEITAFNWVPDFAQGFVRDLRPRWACEEIGLDYSERLISAVKRPATHFADQPWGGEGRGGEGEKSARISPRQAGRWSRRQGPSRTAPTNGHRGR